MIDEHKLARDTARAVQAEALLNNELLNDILAKMEASYIDALFETKMGSSASREELYLAVKILRKVKDHLHKIAADGRLAAADLMRITKATR